MLPVFCQLHVGPLSELTNHLNFFVTELYNYFIVFFLAAFPIIGIDAENTFEEDSSIFFLI